MTVVSMMKIRSQLKLSLPRAVSMKEVKTGLDILREAELMARLQDLYVIYQSDI